jgi:hypothetical protein
VTVGEVRAGEREEENEWQWKDQRDFEKRNRDQSEGDFAFEQRQQTFQNVATFLAMQRKKELQMVAREAED